MLDDLVSVIETLQQRIRDHGPTLRQNETRTRTALIDPLLTALGWDVSDPALVTPEYRVDVGWADYALAGPGSQPAAVIEAKRLGSIVENHLEQSVGYCIQQGIAYSGVTDGDHWQLYRTFEPVPMAQKLVLDIRIGDTPAHECALKLLLLWRPNLASGRPVPASEPVLGSESVPQPIAQMPVSPEVPSIAEEPQTDAVETPALSVGWVPLSEFNPPGRSSPPQVIRLPDGSVQELRRWNDILVQVAIWLSASGNLTVGNVPVRSSARIYIVHSLPTHPTGNQFFGYKTIANGLLAVNTHGSAVQMRKNTQTLLLHCGVDPDTVHLQAGE